MTQYIRPSKDESFMEIAESVSMRSTCLRRRYGAVIVSKDGRIVSTGYNGAPRHRENCTDIGRCLRDELGVKPGTHYELCRAVHAEANAIINGNPLDVIGGTLYLCGTDVATNSPSPHISPCAMCERLILNAQIARVVMRTPDHKLVEVNPLDWDDDSKLLEEHRRNLEAKMEEVEAAKKAAAAEGREFSADDEQKIKEEVANEVRIKAIKAMGCGCGCGGGSCSK